MNKVVRHESYGQVFVLAHVYSLDSMKLLSELWFTPVVGETHMMQAAYKGDLWEYVGTAVKDALNYYGVIATFYDSRQPYKPFT